MPKDKLSQRQLNRALLARQLLLEREAASVPKALERVGGLQAQYAPSMYIGLWSRLKDFHRDDLTRALKRRKVVQGTLMRATIHLVSARDYWPFAVGIRKQRRDWWVRVRPEHPTASEMKAAAKLLRSSLAEGPMRRAEIAKLLGKGPAWTNGVGLWLDLVRIPPSGTWERRQADLYAAAEDWLGPPTITEEEGIGRLVRSYLRGFGPAAMNDIAIWTGLPAKSITAITSDMRLRRFQTEDGMELIDLPGAPLPDPEVPAPVRYLPAWDATLLVHARRTGIMPEQYRPKVFSTKTPHVMTFLVDGAVAGTWKYENGQILRKPFRQLDRTAQHDLQAEGERLAAFYEA